MYRKLLNGARVLIIRSAVNNLSRYWADTLEPKGVPVIAIHRESDVQSGQYQTGVLTRQLD